MSGSEPKERFLSRWSRRKAAAQTPAEPAEAEPPAADLPPIETLGAASDYTVFLARGVASALQAQALRIAWTSDPAIANFRGMAEYAWDFNAPGYGALSAGDDVGALLSRIIRSQLNPQAAAPPIEPEPLPQPPIAAPEPPAVEANLTPEPEPAAPPLPRRHGSALPA